MSKTSRGGKRNQWRKLPKSERVAEQVRKLRGKASRLASIERTGEQLAWDADKGGYPPGFYTYRLIDPALNETFYVGKGQRDRAWQHERNVIAGRISSNRSKNARIQEILDAGHSVRVEVVAIYRAEADALEHEYELIDADPRLTNVALGCLTPDETAAAFERRRLRRQANLAEARERDRQRAVIVDRERKRQQFLAVPNAGRHAAAINEWIDSLPERGGGVTFDIKQAKKFARQPKSL